MAPSTRNIGDLAMSTSCLHCFVGASASSSSALVHETPTEVESDVHRIVGASWRDVRNIDIAPSGTEREAAIALLQSSIEPASTTTLHPLLPQFQTPNFSPLIASAHDTIAQTGALPKGIDLSRYEEPTAPTTASIKAWRDSLRAAYASHEYLSQRSQNLQLLRTYGKDAWLIGNEAVEAEMKALEKEVEEARREFEQVEEERRQRQEGVKGEIEGLEETWRLGLGRAIEVEVAGEMLRREVLAERRRQAAGR
ncbi:hypothetical protein MRB53_037424 [Persea americana]|nr:hypothetical protein MRB53_037424 [Persea americana]